MNFRIFPVFRCCGQHCFTNKLGIFVLPAGEFRRNSVCREKGRRDFQRSFCIQRHQRLELRQFGSDIEPVAGLGFRGGGSMPEHGLRPLAGLVQQIAGCRPARGVHGGNNAAASRHDLHICPALEPHFELGSPVARPHQVGMRVDKSGHHHPSAGIQSFLLREAPDHVPGRTCFNDLFPADQHCSVFNDAQAAKYTTPLCSAG